MTQDVPLTGAQKTCLRGLGQKLDPALNIGRAGLTPAIFKEIHRLLDAHELIKLRFLGADRDERTALITRITGEGHCVSPGAVGHTALVFRQNPEPGRRRIAV